MLWTCAHGWAGGGAGPVRAVRNFTTENSESTESTEDEEKRSSVGIHVGLCGSPTPPRPSPRGGGGQSSALMLLGPSLPATRSM